MKTLIDNIKKLLIKVLQSSLCNWCLLLQEHGFEFSKHLFGTVAVISANNFGSLALGGFIESCSAIKMCRHCMTSRDKSKKKVR